MQELIKKLRCSSSSDSKCDTNCRYCKSDEIPEQYKEMADFQKDGKYYCYSCDCDRICMDAADKLEEVSKWNNS